MMIEREIEQRILAALSPLAAVIPNIDAAGFWHDGGNSEPPAIEKPQAPAVLRVTISAPTPDAACPSALTFRVALTLAVRVECDTNSALYTAASAMLTEILTAWITDHAVLVAALSIPGMFTPSPVMRRDGGSVGLLSGGMTDLQLNSSRLSDVDARATTAQFNLVGVRGGAAV